MCHKKIGERYFVFILFFHFVAIRLVGLTLGHHKKIALKKVFISLVQQHRVNVRTTSKFANKMVYQHRTNVRPTLIFSDNMLCLPSYITRNVGTVGQQLELNAQSRKCQFSTLDERRNFTLN